MYSLQSPRRFLLLVSAFALHFFVCCDASETQQPVVHTTLGAIRGRVEQTLGGRDYYSFRGIPYAAPPVGKLRFKNPVAAPAWDFVLDGTKEAGMCPQYSFNSIMKKNFEEYFGEEDCLFLNVFTPQLSTSGSEGVPVMVYIHGGAFSMGLAEVGSGSSILEEDVVLVVLQYRLGVLGFFSTEDDVAPGNLALKDQRLALKWVQKNIGRFGGDPASVTLFGESAGAACVHLQMLSDHSENLFQRAILMSGTATAPWSITKNARSTAFKVGEHLGCTAYSDDPTTASIQLTECLREKPTREVAGAFIIFLEMGFHPIVTAPIVDGKFIKDHPAVLMKEGKHRNLDIMMGVTQHEGAYLANIIYSFEKNFFALNTKFNEVGPAALMISQDNYQSLKMAAEIYNKYFNKHMSFAKQANECSEMLGDRAFKIPAANTALAYLLNMAGTDNQVYLYELQHRGAQSHIDKYGFQYMDAQDLRSTYLNSRLATDTSGVQIVWNNFRVSHGDQTAYLFPGGFVFKAHENEADKTMTRLTVKLWTNFAKTGNPTPDDNLGFVWEPAQVGSLKHLALKLHPEMMENKNDEIRNFWNSLPLYENILVNPEKFEFVGNQKDEL